jgi:hypothetical protein
MNAKKLKGLLLAYIRFGRAGIYCATECGYYSADVLTIIGKNLVEIETKISMSDLKADLKKRKHKDYIRKNLEDICIPNFFYFAVPYKLKDKALKFIEENNLPYGLITTKEELNGRIHEQVHIVKKSMRLRNNEISDRIKHIIAARMSSELATLYNKMEHK